MNVSVSARFALKKTAMILVKEALIPVVLTERIVQSPLIKPLRQV